MADPVSQTSAFPPAASPLSPIPVRSVAGFRVGHWTDLAGGTGCTAIVAPAGACGGVDVRGGAPASRETDLLRPENTVDTVHAVVLSGGSMYGLEAASGAARELERRGIGLPVGPALAPIVCSSCIFDLAFGDPASRPDVAAGESAVATALDTDASAPLAEGTVGAGSGATVGKLLGPERAMKGGLGARAFALGPLQVGAITSVNACGNVVDPATLEPIAGVRALDEDNGGPAILDMEETMLAMAGSMAMPLARDNEGGAAATTQPAHPAPAACAPRSNTTISCIITNARLTKAQATKVAQMAADAYAHTIRPTHTTNDGDTIYVLASGELPAEAASALPLDLIGLVANRALEAAIVAAVREATGLHGVPAARDLS